jgi:DMSO/TMAO reductase YedYZ molybdopterin-dependent catalytic subunit
MTSRLDRRNFIRWSAVATLTPGVLLAKEKSVSAIPPSRNEYMLQQNGYAVNAETPLDLLTDYVTPNELFFVRSHWIPRTPDLGKWRLVIDGEVERPLKLSLAEVGRMPAVEATCVLQCAGNGRALHDPTLPGVQWRYGAAGNAKWRGVRMRDLLERAGVKAEALHLHTFGSDDPPGSVPPFHRSLELKKALDDCLLAYEMNGVPLPVAHGAPLRLVVPGWAGDHWMKWVTRLTVEREPQKGFYMDTAYRYPLKPGEPGVAFKPEEMAPVKELFVKSNITTAPAKVRTGTAHVIAGFAFSGAPDIEKVELSDDDGATWHEATLDPRHEPHAWRLWSYRWTAPKPGRTVVLARATDSGGAVQPRVAVWNQSGYLFNGWHSATIEVTA